VSILFRSLKSLSKAAVSDKIAVSELGGVGRGLVERIIIEVTLSDRMLRVGEVVSRLTMSNIREHDEAKRQIFESISSLALARI